MVPTGPKKPLRRLSRVVCLSGLWKLPFVDLTVRWPVWVSSPARKGVERDPLRFAEMGFRKELRQEREQSARNAASPKAGLADKVM
jgi:hypothetical protein